MHMVLNLGLKGRDIVKMQLHRNLIGSQHREKDMITGLAGRQSQAKNLRKREGKV